MMPSHSIATLSLDDLCQIMKRDAKRTKSALPTDYHACFVQAKVLLHQHAGQTGLGKSKRRARMIAALGALILEWQRECEKSQKAGDADERMFYLALLTYAGQWLAKLKQGSYRLPDVLKPDNIAPWLAYHQAKTDED